MSKIKEILDEAKRPLSQEEKAELNKTMRSMHTIMTRPLPHIEPERVQRILEHFAEQQAINDIVESFQKGDLLHRYVERDNLHYFIQQSNREDVRRVAMKAALKMGGAL
jgi:hypothetical protein